MDDRFDEAAEAVIAYLEEEGHADTTICETKGRLRGLKAHLETMGPIIRVTRRSNGSAR